MCSHRFEANCSHCGPQRIPRPRLCCYPGRCVSGSVPAACVCVTQWGEAGAEASTQQGKNDSHYPRCDRSHKSGSAFLTAAAPPSAKEVILDLEKTKVTLQSPR